MNELSAGQYDAWYRTPRGAWIGDTEFKLLVELLGAASGEQLLDVGCGTGYFTRRFARDAEMQVTGIDPDPRWIGYAAAQSQPGERYLLGDACALPFAEQSFDCTVCVTALCFIANQHAALREMLRVTRRRLVLGLLNRNSLLWLRKGRGGGRGGYRGAHWHTPSEIKRLLAGLPVRNLQVRSANLVPAGGHMARAVESRVSNRCLLGGFLAVAATIAR